ncbi:DUF922 domain-containing protein [Gelidibacter japonicus]|uniref:DUF922 domain-containing protein n=1 Tax=Gelidibacter japonicus TaxID=1962232 RepID=UPI002AFF204D|nr:DUF922 domain-containing protein [Gelidibacter japonicus]
MIYKLFFILALIYAEQSNIEEVVEWQDTVQLNWSDFKGRPQNLGDVVALTSSGISFKFSIKEGNGQVVGFDTQVQAHFYPKRSWVHKKRSSDHILAHEQLHFDITELYARKFRKEITHLKISKDIKRDLNSLYERIIKDMTVEQSTYDIQTNHSRDAKAQFAWNKKISDALKVYNDYKNPNK